MSRRSPVIAAESRPSLSRGVRMALSYLALFVFTAFALYPISRIVTIALRPGDQLLSSSLAFIPRGATLANFRTLIFETQFLRWLGNSLLIAIAATITGVALACIMYGIEAIGRGAGEAAFASAVLVAGFVVGALALRHLRRHAEVA